MASIIGTLGERDTDDMDDIFAGLPSSLAASSSREMFLAEKRTVYRGESGGVSVPAMASAIVADLSEESTQPSPLKMDSREYHYAPSSKDVDLIPCLRGAAPMSAPLKHMDIPVLANAGIPMPFFEKVPQKGALRSSIPQASSSAKGRLTAPSAAKLWSLRRLAPSDVKQIPTSSIKFAIHGRERIHVDAVPCDVYLCIVESLNALNIFHRFNAKEWRFECLAYEDESKVEFGMIVRRQRKGDPSQVAQPSSSRSTIEMYKMRSNTNVWQIIQAVRYEMENRLVSISCATTSSKKAKLTMQELPLPAHESTFRQPSEDDYRAQVKMLLDKAVPIVNKVEVVVFLQEAVREYNDAKERLTSLGICQVLCTILRTVHDEELLRQSLNFAIALCRHEDATDVLVQQHALVSCVGSILDRYPIDTLSLASLDLHRQMALVIARACETTSVIRKRLVADGANDLVEMLKKSDSETVRSAANMALMRIAP